MVTLAISAIVMTVISTGFSFLFNVNKDITDGYNAQATAQNVLGQIKNELQYASAITIETDAAASKLDSDYNTGNYLYFLNYGVYKKTPATAETLITKELKSIAYSCSLSFTNPATSGLRSVIVTVTILKKGATLFSLTTTINCNNLSTQGHTVNGVTTGSAIKFSTDIAAQAAASQVNVSFINVESDTSAISANMGTLAMRATVYPSNATNLTVAWTVSDPTLAKIDPLTGVLTAMANGSLTVKATAVDGSNVSATSAAITLSSQTIKVTSFTISAAGSVKTMSRNSTLKITAANILPSTAVNKTISWEVNNPSYASIDSTGKITAGSTGNVSIIVTARSTDGWAITQTLEILIT